MVRSQQALQSEDKWKIMDSTQHKSCTGRSKVPQHIIQYDTVIRLMKTRNNVDTVYIDLAKASDTVYLQLLI